MLPLKRTVEGELTLHVGDDVELRRRGEGPRELEMGVGADVLGPECTHSSQADRNFVSPGGDMDDSGVTGSHTETTPWEEIYSAVVQAGRYNYLGARAPVPSGLCVDAWRKRLEGYGDRTLVEFLEFGWPANCDRGMPIVPTWRNHPSAMQHPQDVEYYITTEKGHGAILGPFPSMPFNSMQISPLMTREKRDSEHRRIIMDLSWPHGASVNDAIQTKWYVDGPATIHLPTVDYMVGRLRNLGQGSYLYKTDLARGYRQLRIDPLDWPLLGFVFEGEYYFDLCPPFGMRTSALCMQRTSEAICWMHGQDGYVSRPYLDDFGGAEATVERAERALTQLQSIMAELGVKEAAHKVCRPAKQMIWLGLWYDSVDMTVSIPEIKLREIMETLEGWRGRTRATQREMQQLFGLLQFVAGVSPPARVFTNRMLANLREMPQRGSDTLSLGFKQDLSFFLDLLPHYNGVRIIIKDNIEQQELLELDACLTGCGALAGDSYYAEEFPLNVSGEGHAIARLELLNIVVAVKVWCERWRGQIVVVHCDNTNACAAIRSGRSRDPFTQHCVRELFVYRARYDIELRAEHRPGKTIRRADALSRMHKDRASRAWVRGDPLLARASRILVPKEYFELLSEV